MSLLYSFKLVTWGKDDFNRRILVILKTGSYPSPSLSSTRSNKTADPIGMVERDVNCVLKATVSEIKKNELISCRATFGLFEIILHSTFENLLS